MGFQKLILYCIQRVKVKCLHKLEELLAKMTLENTCFRNWLMSSLAESYTRKAEHTLLQVVDKRSIWRSAGACCGSFESTAGF